MATNIIKNDRQIPVWKVVLLTLLGFILMSSAALVIRNVLNEPAVIDQKVVDERVERLKKHREEEHLATTTYKWEDKAGGVVRVPLDKAALLAAPEISARVIKKSTVPVMVSVPPAPAPAAAGAASTTVAPAVAPVAPTAGVKK